MSICKRIKKYPREAGDIGDIGDIFRKSLKLQDFLQAPSGDIPGDIFGVGDALSHARKGASGDDLSPTV